MFQLELQKLALAYDARYSLQMVQRVDVFCFSLTSNPAPRPPEHDCGLKGASAQPDALFYQGYCRHLSIAPTFLPCKTEADSGDGSTAGVIA